MTELLNRKIANFAEKIRSHPQTIEEMYHFREACKTTPTTNEFLDEHKSLLSKLIQVMIAMNA